MSASRTNVGIGQVVRRVLSTALVVAVTATIVAIDRRHPPTSEGATAAVDPLAGFPGIAAGGRISTSWFCPGVAAGDGVDQARVVLVNPGDVDYIATVRLLSNETSPLERVVVAPRSRQEIDVLRGRTVGVVVPIVEIVGSVGTVEQELIYAAGDVTSQCVSQTAARWYFADGFTAEGSTQRLIVTNPFPESAVVNVSYTTADGRRTPGALQGMILAPRTARSIALAEFGGQDERRLAVEVDAVSGQVVASRTQHYLGGGRLGYSTTVGVPAPRSQWWFTAGRTGSQVTEELVVFNPGKRSSFVTVSFFGEGITNGLAANENNAAAVPSAEVEIPAGEIVGIDTNAIADLPKGDHAMVVSVVDGDPVVVEHVLSQQASGGFFTAVTNGVPLGLESTVWRVPTGLARGARNALSILNTTAEDGVFTLSAIGPGGEVELPGLVDVALGAAAVVSLNVPEGATEGEIVIRSSVPVVVQRRTARGHGLAGFGIVGALAVKGR